MLRRYGLTLIFVVATGCAAPQRAGEPYRPTTPVPSDYPGGVAGAAALATMESVRAMGSDGRSIRGLCVLKVGEHDTVESPCRNVSLKFVGPDGLDAGAIMPDDAGKFYWSAPAGKAFQIVPFSKKYGIMTEPAGPFRAGQTVLIHLAR